MDRLIEMALAEDLGDRGDVTSLATIPMAQTAVARITAKAPGVVAGLPLVSAVFQQVDPNVYVQTHVEDGAHVVPRVVVAELTGSARSLLTGERTALNFLQHLSGIATLTALFVAAVSETQARILDTRKTTPGWRALEKYAVHVGGGVNHRMGLFDMVMIKDNHVDASGGITAAVNRVRADANASGLPIEVEVRTLDELREALSLDVERIMLDNMDEAMMREAVAIAAGRTPLEASGNMSLARVGAVAATGVDYISVGALTHSAPVLDLSMKIIE